MVKENVKQRIKFCVTMIVIAVAIAFAVFTVMKYEVEGEKEVPFSMGKIIVISSATTADANVPDETAGNNAEAGSQEANGEEQVNSNENGENAEQPQEEQQNNDASNNQEGVTEQGNSEASGDGAVQSEEENYIWNEKVIQTNDVYIYLDKNVDFDGEEIIKSVKIENLKVLENVKLGKIQVYMPNSLDDGLYKYTNEFLVNSTLTYIGATADDKKNLEIGNQGGCVCLSFANVGLGNYKSNNDQEMEQGGSILQKMNIANDDLKFKVSFDLVIEVQDMSYKTNVVLDLPAEDLVGQRETHKEITDFNDVVFKRL